MLRFIIRKMRMCHTLLKFMNIFNYNNQAYFGLFPEPSRRELDKILNYISNDPAATRLLNII